MSEDQTLKLLVPTSMATQLSRRGFLRGVTLTAAAAAALSACGSSGSLAGTPGSSAPSASALPTALEKDLNFFTWADYDDPALVKAFATKEGLTTHLDVYGSNVEAIAKLSAAKGTAGYDIYVPSGNYVPELLRNNLLLKLDHSRIPNIKNLDPQVTGQYWDPKNEFSVCKDWGTTGYVYDTTVIKRELTTWADFVDAMGKEASGKTSVLEESEQLVGLYFWSKSPVGDWSSEDSAELDAAETFILDKVAPHIKAYDSYPGAGLAAGKYALMMCWNGDARTGLMAAKEPDRYRWVLGSPATERWMDNWTILASAPHPAAAHAWINNILDPDVSYMDLQFHSYNTGIAGQKEMAVASKLPRNDVIFFTDEQVKTMSTYKVGLTLQRRLDILQKAKARSAAG